MELIPSQITKEEFHTRRTHVFIETAYRSCGDDRSEEKRHILLFKCQYIVETRSMQKTNNSRTCVAKFFMISQPYLSLAEAIPVELGHIYLLSSYQCNKPTAEGIFKKQRLD